MAGEDSAHVVGRSRGCPKDPVASMVKEAGLGSHAGPVGSITTFKTVSAGTLSLTPLSSVRF